MMMGERVRTALPLGLCAALVGCDGAESSDSVSDAASDQAPHTSEEDEGDDESEGSQDDDASMNERDPEGAESDDEVADPDSGDMTQAPRGDGGATIPGGDVTPPARGDVLDLADDWVELPLEFAPLSGTQSEYQTRGWCTLRFVPGRDTLVFYEGARESSRGNFCIYANALYELEPRSGVVYQRSLSNWYCDDSGGYRRLPDLPDTPVDRHTYSQFAYAPSTDSVYMVGGAAARFPMADHPFDFWRFSFAEGAWEKMPDSYPNAEEDRSASRGAYTANLLYHPPSNSLYYFKSSSSIHTFDLTEETWRTLETPPGAETVHEVGAHGLYDPERDRFAFYGNNWDPNDEGTTEFLWFDAGAQRWEEQAVPASGPGRKSYASLEYNSRHDVYMLHGGWRESDTWVYDPSVDEWQQLQTASAPPPDGTGTYVAYDPSNDALMRFDEASGKLYALRFDPAL